MINTVFNPDISRGLNIKNLRIFSPAFTSGDRIPKRYTSEGENISPPLEWSGLPSRHPDWSFWCFGELYHNEKPDNQWYYGAISKDLAIAYWKYLSQTLDSQTRASYLTLIDLNGIAEVDKPQIKYRNRTKNLAKNYKQESNQTIQSPQENPPSMNKSQSQIFGNITIGGTNNPFNPINYANGVLLNTIKVDVGSVYSVSFSPDNKILAAGSDDGRLRLWDLDLDQLQKRACNQVSDYLSNNPNINEIERHLCDKIGTDK